MKTLLDLFNVLDGKSLILWTFTSLIFSLIVSYTDIYIFTNLFRVQSSNSKKIKLFLLDSIFNFLCSIFIPAPYFRIINMIIDIFLFKIFFKQSIEKCILGGTINLITVICTEVIFVKIFSMTFSSKYSYKELIYDYKYNAYLMSSISLVRALMADYIKNFKLKIMISEHLNNENKFDIAFISIICCIFIFLNIERMLLFILDFPNSIFGLELILLILYFGMSIKNVFKIAKYDEKDMKIQNLEEYNKTLSAMYDSVKVIKHNFSNFIQALDGYAQVNDIEGIKTMCNSICKECNEVTNMEWLNPKIINNPAIYSIITSKFHLAQESNITMSVEVMYNLKEIETYIYELCNILGILLDNAIEATKGCEEKIINVKFLKDFRSNSKFMIVENSYDENELDVSKIFDKGYSTKKRDKESHGLGLWHVKKIISHYDKLNIFTSKDKLFCQKIEICS